MGTDVSDYEMNLQCKWDILVCFLCKSKAVRMGTMNVKRFTFADTIPLTQWDDGTIRVIGSRVTLDTLVHRFQIGDTFEEIHEGFPSVSLEQINLIIGWYLDHKAEADEYLQEREAEGERLRLESQSRPEYKAFHERLLRRIEQFNKT